MLGHFDKVSQALGRANYTDAFLKSFDRHNFSSSTWSTISYPICLTIVDRLIAVFHQPSTPHLLLGLAGMQLVYWSKVCPCQTPVVLVLYPRVPCPLPPFFFFRLMLLSAQSTLSGQFLSVGLMLPIFPYFEIKVRRVPYFKFSFTVPT